MVGFLECGKLIDAYKHKQVHVCGKKPHMCRFLIDMPSGWVFITSAILLQLAEGAGWAMYDTSALTLLAQLFPNHVATATVCEHSFTPCTFVYMSVLQIYDILYTQGFLEVAGSMGYGLGPPIGGLLYAVRSYN